jgi:hypothetical protein
MLDSRIGRWFAKDPKEAKNPNFSPYAAFENNPVFFIDPDGKDAIGTVNGNTITISAIIYVKNTGLTSIDLAKAQKDIMKVWGGDNYKYTDKNGKVYNVKFEAIVMEMPKPKRGGQELRAAHSNTVRPMGKEFRSEVRNFNLGYWQSEDDDATYAHEFGHFLGLADQYTDVTIKKEFRHLSLDGGNGVVGENYESTKKDEIMGIAANDNNEGNAVVSQKDIDALASFVIQNQKDGQAIINVENLKKAGKTEGLASPTQKDKVAMSKKYDGTHYETKDDSN